MSEQLDRLKAQVFRMGKTAAIKDPTTPRRYPNSDLPYRSRNPFPQLTTSYTRRRLFEAWRDGYWSIQPPDLDAIDTSEVPAAALAADIAFR